MLLLWTSLLLIGWTSAGPIPWPEQGYSNDTNNHRYCVVEDKMYRADELIPTSTSCHQCVCRPPDVLCEHVRCEKKVGCRTIQLVDQCCPQYQCECESNGRIYNNGEKLETTDSPCKVCFCRGGEIHCTPIQCYTRDDCTPQQVPGRCCPKYDHCPPIDKRINSLRTTVWSSPPTATSLRPEPPVTHNEIFKTSASDRFELLGEVSQGARISSPEPSTLPEEEEEEDGDDQDPMESSPQASLTPLDPTATSTTPFENPSDSDASASENAPAIQHKTILEETTAITAETNNPGTSTIPVYRETDEGTTESETKPTPTQPEEHEVNEQPISETTELMLPKDDEDEDVRPASEKRTHIQTIPPRVKEDASTSTSESQSPDTESSQLPNATVNTEDNPSVSTSSEASTQETTTNTDYNKVTFIPFETNMTASPYDDVTESIPLQPETKIISTVIVEETTTAGTALDEQRTEENEKVQKDFADKVEESDNTGLDVNHHTINDVITPEKDLKPTTISDQETESQRPLEITTELGQTESYTNRTSITSSSHEDTGSSSGEDSWEHHRPTQMVTDEIHYITTAPPVKDESHTHIPPDVSGDRQQSSEELPPRNFTSPDSLIDRYEKLGESELPPPNEAEATPFTVNGTLSPQDVTEVPATAGANDANTSSVTDSMVTLNADAEKKEMTLSEKLGEEKLDGDEMTKEILTSTPKHDELSVATDGMDDRQNNEGKYESIDRSDDGEVFDITSSGISDSEVPQSFELDHPTYLDETTLSGEGETLADLEKTEEQSTEDSTDRPEEKTADESFTTSNIDGTSAEASTEPFEDRGSNKDDLSSDYPPGLSFPTLTLLNEQPFDSPPVIKLSEEMANHQMVVEIHHITPVVESTENLEGEELTVIQDANKEDEEKRKNVVTVVEGRPSPDDEGSDVISIIVPIYELKNEDATTDGVLKDEEARTKVEQLLLESEGTTEIISSNVQEQTTTAGTLEETVSGTTPTTVQNKLLTADASTIENEFPSATEEADTTVETPTTKGTSEEADTTVETPTTKGTSEEQDGTVTETERTTNDEKLAEDIPTSEASESTTTQNTEENSTTRESSESPEVKEDAKSTVSYDSLQNSSSDSTPVRETSGPQETTSGEEISQLPTENMSSPDQASVMLEEKNSLTNALVQNTSLNNHEVQTRVPENITVGEDESTSQGNVSVESSDQSNKTTVSSLETSVVEETINEETNDNSTETRQTYGDVLVPPEEPTPSEVRTTEEDTAKTVTPDEEKISTTTENSSVPIEETADSEYERTTTKSPELESITDIVTNGDTTEVRSSPVNVTTPVTKTPSVGPEDVNHNSTRTSIVTATFELDITTESPDDGTSSLATNSGDRQTVTTIDTSTETHFPSTSTELKETTHVTDDHQHHTYINDLSSTTFLDESTDTPEPTGSVSPAQENTFTDNSLTSALPEDTPEDLASVLQFQANKTKDTNATLEVEEHLAFESNRTTTAGDGDQPTTSHHPPEGEEDVFTRLQREDVEELGKYDLELLQNFFKNLYVKDDHHADLASES